MRYSLTRLTPDDGKGISGAMIMTHFREKADGDVETDTELQTPTVGWQVLFESFQHWYRTSPITEILEEEETEEGLHITFKTENSIYSWRKFG